MDVLRASVMAAGAAATDESTDTTLPVVAMAACAAAARPSGGRCAGTGECDSLAVWDCAPRPLRESDGVRCVAESGEAVGASVGVARSRVDVGSAVRDGVTVRVGGTVSLGVRRCVRLPVADGLGSVAESDAASVRDVEVEL